MDITKEEFELAKLKADLANSIEYKKIRDLQLNKCLELSKSDIEPLELKGMLKLIASTDSWTEQFEKLNKSRLQQNEE
jgi:hypothetical protein